MQSNLKNLSIVFSFICTLLTSDIGAQTQASNAIPKDFRYQNQPIDSLCIEKMINLVNPSEKVNLDECSKHTNYQIEGVNNELAQKGYIGFDYIQEDAKFPLHAGTYYKYLGKVGDLHLVYGMQQTGGSGFFTGILLIKRVGNHLQLEKTVALGDRCNGGVSDPSFKDKKLSYKQALTAYDVIALSKNKPATLKAYDDLAACAACCEATAVYEDNFEQSKLTAVQFEKETSNLEQGKYQSCFNTLANDYKQKGKLKLSEEELNQFVSEFNEKCLPKSQ